MTDLVSLTIDDKPVQVARGTLIVDAAKRADAEIPVFCYHPKMAPVGMCRMCLVEVGRPAVDRNTRQPILNEDGTPRIDFAPKLETSCTTPVSEGMAIRTASQKVKAAQDDVLEFLLTSHPLDCPVCDKGGECPLQNLTMRWGPGQSRFLYDEKMHLAKHVPLGTPDDALIFLDRERCIQCARCTRFSDEIADDHVIGFYERGRKLEIITFSEPGFDSKFSGNTTDICPVGALTTADFRFGARPWELTPAASVCSHCPVGCNTTLSIRREAKSGGGFAVKRVMPRQNEQVNEIWMCDKGRFGHHFATSPDRLTHPLVRVSGKLVESSWDKALSVVAETFGKAAGAGLVGVAGDRLSNEDLFNFRKLVEGAGGKVALNSPMGGGGPVQQVGVGVGTNFSAMRKGTAILVVASDLEEEAPVWWLRVKQAAARGATLIVANARTTKTDRNATHKIRYHYGDEAATVQALVNGASPEAQAFAQAENGVILFGSDGLDFAGTEALAQACADLLVATGHYGKANNGLIGVWPRGNTQGAWDMGVRPTGQSVAEMTSGAKAAYVVGTDPVGEGDEVKATFVVVQELFLTETAKRADVVLPAQSFVEREGTYTNGERRVQRFYPGAPARGVSQGDWRIAAEIGTRLGLPLKTSSPAAVMLEIANEIPAYEGITYQQLAQVEKQWPDVGGADLYYGGTSYANEQGLGAQVKSAAEMGLFVAESGQLVGATVPGRPGQAHLPRTQVPGETPAPTHGFVAAPTTLLYDRGSLFVKSEVMLPRIPGAFVELNSADAARLGITDGERVRVSFPGGEVTVNARVNGRAPEGVALLPRGLGVSVPARAISANVSRVA